MIYSFEKSACAGEAIWGHSKGERLVLKLCFFVMCLCALVKMRYSKHVSCDVRYSDPIEGGILTRKKNRHPGRENTGMRASRKLQWWPQSSSHRLSLENEWLRAEWILTGGSSGEVSA